MAKTRGRQRSGQLGFQLIPSGDDAAPELDLAFDPSGPSRMQQATVTIVTDGDARRREIQDRIEEGWGGRTGY